MSVGPGHDNRDQGWLVGLRAGDQGAFEGIFLAYAAELWEFAVRYVAPDVADDVVQDVLYAVWERHETLEITTTLRAYLFGAVRRKALEYVRHDRVVDSAESQTGEDHAVWMGEDPLLPDAAAHLSELEEALDLVLATLPQRQKTLLTLRWRYGMSYEQISEVLGISVAAAKMQVSRTQRVIRPLLERFIRE